MELVLGPDVGIFDAGFRAFAVGADGVRREFAMPRGEHMLGHVRGRRSSSRARLHVDAATGLMRGTVALDGGATCAPRPPFLSQSLPLHPLL